MNKSNIGLFDCCVPYVTWCDCGCLNKHIYFKTEIMFNNFMISVKFVFLFLQFGFINYFFFLFYLQIFACVMYVFWIKIIVKLYYSYFSQFRNSGGTLMGVCTWYDTVALVFPLPNPNDPHQHEACCPLCKHIRSTSIPIRYRAWISASLTIFEYNIFFLFLDVKLFLVFKFNSKLLWNI